jgi:hypothetical protein
MTNHYRLAGLWSLENRDKFLAHPRLALRALAHGNSRFCFLKFTKPADEHHLQVCPDRFSSLHHAPKINGTCRY